MVRPLSKQAKSRIMSSAQMYLSEGSVISQRSFLGFKGLPTACWVAVVAVFICLLGQSILGGAQTLGGVTGTVTDSTGAAVSGAQIEVTNEATGILAKAASTQAGSFSVTALTPGAY